MDVSQLPNIDGLLVTEHNPARVSSSGMDYGRCAALHNYIVLYAHVAEGRPVDNLNSDNTFFATHGALAEAIRPRLHDSLEAFLDAAILSPLGDPEFTPFFFWASGFPDPDGLFDNSVADLFDQPVDSLVTLYFPNIGQGGESGGGLLYHQGHHLAAVFMHMDDHDFALPVEAHPSLWHPLETIFSNWIELIRLGKVTASPSDAPALFAREKIGPWEWQPYSEAQVAACLGAWDRLCESIEARAFPQVLGTDNIVELEPLLTSSALDAASVPEPSFVRAFLSRARRPKFRYIAPGLVVPPADASEFAALQPFTRVPRDPQVIAPVCLFPTAGGAVKAGLTESSPFYHDFCSPSLDSPVPPQVPAGIYSESVNRGDLDIAEEGFWMLLPYGLRGVDEDLGIGARKSDGSSVRSGSMSGLFQHGYKPFGGDYYRPQRLERLLDHWCKLVDESIWPVGPQGVIGTIDTFRQADTGQWRDYVIAPTW